MIFSWFKFQGFNWESWRRQWYLELATKAADLSRCGITAVWLPPPTESVAPQGSFASFIYFSHQTVRKWCGPYIQLEHCLIYDEIVSSLGHFLDTIVSLYYLVLACWILICLCINCFLCLCNHCWTMSSDLQVICLLIFTTWTRPMVLWKSLKTASMKCTTKIYWFVFGPWYNYNVLFIILWKAAYMWWFIMSYQCVMPLDWKN